VKRVVYDTNVVLDVLLQRDPHFQASAKALDAAGCGQVEGYLAGHAITTIAYMLQKVAGMARARLILSDLLSRLQVAPITDAVIRLALASPLTDFEDAVCHAAAEEVNAVVIVTRNVSDFAKGAIPAILPDLFQLD